MLIQAVAQTIPLYVMNCYKLPRRFLHELDMLVAGYWWGDNGTKKKIHWKNWEALCCSKLDGGLGLKAWRASTWHCWPNSGGESLIMLIH